MASMIPWRGKRRGEDSGEVAPLTSFRREMDRLFDTFLREPMSALDWPRFGRGEWLPAVDVLDGEDEVTVRAEIPGMDPKDLSVSITGSQLTLSGEKKESTEKKEQGYYQSETRYGSFSRVVPLPEGVDRENVDAQYANGVLTLKLKKKPEAAPKKIQVKVQG